MMRLFRHIFGMSSERSTRARSYEYPVLLSTLRERYGSLTIFTEESGTVSKYTVRRETVQVRDGLHELHRWVVTRPDGELYGYSTTWFGAWRMIHQAMGWKVPR